MKKQAKTEIVIPTWAGRTGSAYWGEGDYSVMTASHLHSGCPFGV